MRQRTRIVLAVVGGVILVLALAALIVPRLISLEPVRAVIVSQLSQRLGAAVQIGSLRLSLVPLPHLVLTGVVVSIPETADATLPLISVRPRLTSLIRGHPQLASVRIHRPTIKITLGSGGNAAHGEQTAALPRSIGATLAAVSAAGATIGPETVLIVDEAQVDAAGRGTDVSLHNIELRARVGASGPTNVDLELHGSFPQITMQEGAQSVDVRGASFDVDVSVVGDAIRATLTDLEIEAPRARVSGRFTLDQTPPRAELDVLGKDVDVGSVRAAALTFASDMALVASIFDVLRGGTARRITVRGEAASLAELGDAIAIKGTLTNGAIHIGGAGLDLVEVSGNATVINNILEGVQASARVGNSRATAGSLRVGLSGDAPELRVEATVQADAADLPVQIERIVRTGAVVDGMKRLSNVQGTLSGKLTIGGTTRTVSLLAEASQVNVSGQYQGWPGAIQVTGGPIALDDGGMKASGLQINTGQSQLAATSLAIGWSGAPSLATTLGPSRLVLGELFPATRSAGLVPTAKGGPNVLEGTVAVNSLSVNGPLDAPGAWKIALTGAADGLRVEPPLFGDWLALREPLALGDIQLTHDPGRGSSLSATLAAAGDLQGKIDVGWRPREVNVKRLELHDRDSNVSLSVLVQPQTWSIGFAGRLVEATVGDFLPKAFVSVGSVSGTFRTQIPVDQPMAATIQGHLQIDELAFPLSKDVRWSIQRLSLDGDRKPVRVSAVVRTETAGLVDVAGTVAPGRDAINVNLDASAARFDLSALAESLARREHADGSAAPTDRLPPVRGTVRIAIDEFTYEGFTSKPFRAALTLAPSGTTATITKASVCGIEIPGSVRWAGGQIDLSVKPAAKNESLDATNSCLFKRPGMVTGQYTLNGSLTAQGATDEIAKKVNGPVAMTATKGQVQRLPVLSKVFSVISIATGSVGNIFGIGDSGLPYDQLAIKVALDNGALRFTEAILDGPTVKIVGEGTVNLVGQTIEGTLLVAPLVAADKLVGKIPVVRGLVGGNLVSIPVHVSGPLDDPAASLLPETGVSGTLIGAMKKTVSFPLRAIEGLFR